MATAKSKDAKSIATLKLAMAIIEANSIDVQAAIDAGADPQAFWIDGKTSLAELARQRGVEIGPKTKKPRAAKTEKEAGEPEYMSWNKESLVFAAMRGYNFAGETTPRDKGRWGSPIRPIRTAKSALRLIANNWDFIERVFGYSDSHEKDQTAFTVEVGARWDLDRRIVGFKFSFMVDTPDDELRRACMAAKKDGTQNSLPDPDDRALDAQKAWEGLILADDFAYRGNVTLEDAIACLRKGANPFYVYEDYKFGDGADPGGTAFMNALREAVAPERGWHRRIAPHLTPKGIEAIKAKVQMQG